MGAPALTFLYYCRLVSLPGATISLARHSSLVTRPIWLWPEAALEHNGHQGDYKQGKDSLREGRQQIPKASKEGLIGCLGWKPLEGIGAH